jgi:hypothetical protein
MNRWGRLGRLVQFRTLVAICLAGILALLAWPYLNLLPHSRPGKPEDAIRVSTIAVNAFAAGIHEFARTYGRFPQDGREANSFVTRNIKGLTVPHLSPRDATSPLDAWGNPIDYRTHRRGRAFTIISYGADGLLGGAGPGGDIIRRGTLGETRQ